MSSSIKDYGDTQFVTGMRAYACLGVLLIHCGGAGLSFLGHAGANLVDLGRFGVSAFFVISGFSIGATYAKSGGALRFLFLRFFRLAPLYYLWLLLYLLVFQRHLGWAEGFGVLPLGLDLALHLSFLHGFHVQSANSILSVEWSLAVEMFWYACSPVLCALFARGRGHWVLWAGVLWSLAYFSALNALGAHPWLLLWHPFSHFLPFALGLWAWQQRAERKAQGARGGTWAGLLLFVLYNAASASREGFWLRAALVVPFITYLLLVYADAEDRLCRWIFLNRPIVWLGAFSYGLYLTHIMVMHFLKPQFGGTAPALLALFALTVAGCAVLAWLGHRFIEAPMIQWSRRVWPLVNKSAAAPSL